MDALKQAARRETETGRGRHSASPLQIPLKGWKDILWRTWGEVTDDRITLIAAGATYFLLLSLFPLLAAFVSIYGLFNDPATAAHQVALLSNVVPAAGMDVISEQLVRLASQSTATLGIGLLVSLGLALWSASAGVKTMFEAMNIAYGEREDRGFFVLNGLALLFVLAGLVGALMMVGVVVVLPAAFSILGFPTGMEGVIQGAGYLLLAIALFAGILALYRFGPSRQQARWRWLIPGAVLAVLAILFASLLFSWYSANLANFDKTYGSLGGLIGFLLWIWITATAVIVGAELSAEAEHQTARDSTIGPDAPLGYRNATMADTIGKSIREAGSTTDAQGSAVARSAVSVQKASPVVGRWQFSPAGALIAIPIAFVLARLIAGRVGHNRSSRQEGGSNQA